jgi:uncharacterized protein (DUF362 family)
MPRSILSFNPGKADISVVNGTNYYESTIKAMDALGSMTKFVKKGDSVGLLVNSAFDQKGAYVQPDIPLAVIRMCTEAEAGRIICLQKIADDYWNRKYIDLDFSVDLEMLEQVETNVFPAEFNEEEWELIKEPKGAELLKDTEVIKAVLDLDVFINIPIAKHHGTTLYTGALKNMMGLCTRKSNVNMHLGSGERNDPIYLGQSIAEINLIRKPDLIVVDATEFITSNGPSGPGEMKKMDKVVAGTDIVAVDALCCSYVNFSSDEIVSISKAHDMGIGNKNYYQLNISEITL